jgi:hypothetical protein
MVRQEMMALAPACTTVLVGSWRRLHSTWWGDEVEGTHEQCGGDGVVGVFALARYRLVKIVCSSSKVVL